LRNIGNDIVDLCHPDAIARWDDIRFADRVFTPAEQEQVRSSAFPDICLWIFWAAKESAYKAISKSFPEVSSSPRKYEASFGVIEFPSVVQGRVTTPEKPVQVQVVIEKDFVHGLGITGLTQDFYDIETGIYQIGADHEIDCILPEQESFLVRELAGKRIAAHANVPVSEVQIRREPIRNQPGPPEVYIKGEKSMISISLSHDGRFVAYAFSRLDP